MYILLDTDFYVQIVTCAVQFAMHSTGPEKEKKCCQVRREKLQKMRSSKFDDLPPGSDRLIVH